MCSIVFEHHLHNLATGRVLVYIHRLQLMHITQTSILRSDTRNFLRPSNTFQDEAQLDLGENSISNNWEAICKGYFLDLSRPKYIGKSCSIGRFGTDMTLLNSPSIALLS